MFAGDPYSKFENHEKVIRKLAGKRNPSETNNPNETRRSIHSVSGKVITDSLGTNPGGLLLTGDFFDLIKDINEIDGLGRTALHWTSIMGHRNGLP